MGVKEKKSKSMGLNYIALDQAIQKEHGKSKKKSKQKKAKEFENSPGVVFLKHIPYGFFEPQMKRYFEQFGKVTRLRLARSKKTGKSKGYAYIEFAHQDVAKLVADTMNNYLMFTRILKCDFVPYEDLHEKAFVGCHRVFQKPKTRKLAILRYNRRAALTNNKTDKLSTSKKEKLALALEKLGLKYNTDDLSGNPDFVAPPRKCTKQEKKVAMDTEGAKTEDSKTEDSKTEDSKTEDSKTEETQDEGNVSKPEDVDEKSGEEKTSAEESSAEVTHEDVGVEGDPNTSSMSSASDYDDKNVLVVDENDPEITFKTPPFVKKVISLEEHVERQKKRSRRKRKKQIEKLEEK